VDNSTPYYGFLRLLDAFVVGLAEREPGDFVSTVVYNFQPLSVG
jgi:hypothetical protein